MPVIFLRQLLQTLTDPEMSLGQRSHFRVRAPFTMSEAPQGPNIFRQGYRNLGLEVIRADEAS
jgi:hypothetical protein